MDYSTLIQFVPQQLLILVAALWVVGYFVKNTQKIPDAYIPFVLMVLAIAGSILMMGTNVTSVLQGIISAAVAVLGKNIVKQGAEIISSKDVTDVLEDMVNDKKDEVKPVEDQKPEQ
jgi:4-hydroxybenzoate polyprenyltransferase